MIALDLELEPLELGHHRGRREASRGAARVHPRCAKRYRYPYPEALVDFPNTDFRANGNPIITGGAFDFELPALTEAGASLCLVGTSDEDDRLST